MTRSLKTQPLQGWSASSIGDLSHLSIVITGANSGLGFEVARECAAHGAHVTLAVRSLDRGNAASAKIASGIPETRIDVIELDLSSLQSVRSCASALLARDRGIDVLINNAGVMATPKETTVDGFERQFATNHLGHFALTGLLFPMLDANKARVVALSSIAARKGAIHFDDIHIDRSYDRWVAYQQSKLANLMFGLELSERSPTRGHDVTSVTAHPGVTSTNLGSALKGASGSSSTGLFAKIESLMFDATGQPVERGALPVLAAAVGPVSNGDYIGPAGIGEFRGKTVGDAEVPKAARSTVDRDRLWDLSQDLTGVSFL